MGALAREVVRSLVGYAVLALVGYLVYRKLRADVLPSPAAVAAGVKTIAKGLPGFLVEKATGQGDAAYITREEQQRRAEALRRSKLGF